MQQIATLVAEDDELLRATANLIVDTTDPASELLATAWWRALTDAGGEGMVVKPTDFVVRGRRGVAQPALTVRGREYLRIIYGPEYAAPHYLERLRRRSRCDRRRLRSCRRLPNSQPATHTSTRSRGSAERRRATSCRLMRKDPVDRKGAAPRLN
jgi:PNKP adenylyltransferase domain, ligase domain